MGTPSITNAKPCAHIGVRPLSYTPDLAGTRIPILDDLNKEPVHEHIIFDENGENIGYGPTGLFTEDVSKQNYRFHDDTCYDPATMRKAIAETAAPKPYGLLFNNCQTYVEQVLKKYSEILKGKVLVP